MKGEYRYSVRSSKGESHVDWPALHDLDLGGPASGLPTAPWTK